MNVSWDYLTAQAVESAKHEAEKSWLKNYSFQSPSKGCDAQLTITNNGHSEGGKIFTAITRVPDLQEHLQGPKNLIMSSLVLPQVPGELRRDRSGHQLDRLSPLSKADSDSTGGSPHPPQQLPPDKRAGSFVRKVKQGVYSTLHKLRRRGAGDVAMSRVRRVSVLELRFGSPTNTSHQGPSYPVAWHPSGR